MRTNLTPKRLLSQHLSWSFRELTCRCLQAIHLERLRFQHFYARAPLDGTDPARNSVYAVKCTGQDQVFILR
jgi:hypothetical protein